MEEQTDTPCAWKAGEWGLRQSCGQDLSLMGSFRAPARGLGFLVSVMETFWHDLRSRINVPLEGQK